MFDWLPFGHDDNRVRDLRRDMIDETNRFLSWALSAERNLPRIPRRRVDDGGFRDMMRMPGVKKLVGKWWARTLDYTWPDRW